MTWFKVDDGLPEHRKVRRLGRDKAPAMGVWVLCGAWVAANLNDGFVPDEVVQRYDSRSKYSARLVEVGLWLRAEEDGERGYRFHDWADIQPTRADIEARREEVRKRVQKHRQGTSNGVRPPDHDPHDGAPAPDDDSCGNALPSELGNADGNALQEPLVTDLYSSSRTAAGARPVPSRPVLKSKKTTSGIASRPRPDVDQLCDLLHVQLAANGVQATIGTQWRTAARLLLDRDHRPLAEALRLITWSTKHHFWSTNVLSMPTFRKQYDKLRLQEKAESSGRHLKAVGISATELPDDDYRRWVQY